MYELYQFLSPTVNPHRYTTLKCGGIWWEYDPAYNSPTPNRYGPQSTIAIHRKALAMVEGGSSSIYHSRFTSVPPPPYIGYAGAPYRKT